MEKTNRVQVTSRVIEHRDFRQVVDCASPLALWNRTRNPNHPTLARCADWGNSTNTLLKS